MEMFCDRQWMQGVCHLLTKVLLKSGSFLQNLLNIVFTMWIFRSLQKFNSFKSCILVLGVNLNYHTS